MIHTTTGRPPAPELNFGVQVDAGVEVGGTYQPHLSKLQHAREATEETLSCRTCGSVNPESSSFCCECGALLRTIEKLRPLGGTVLAPGSLKNHEGGGTAPDNKGMNGSPVVREPNRTPGRDRQSSRPSLRVLPPFQNCPRCRGANSPEARFCQLCGVPLSTDESALEGSPPEPAPLLAPESALPDAWLVVIGQDGTPGRRYSLHGASTEIGRSSGDILLEKDPYVCPVHARITYGSRGYCVEDLGSVNGVYVRLGGSPVELGHGDLLLLGQAVLRFEIVEETERSISPAIRDSTRVFGSPAVARRARLVVHTVEGCGRDIFYLSRPETILGREAGDIVFTDDPFMSRRHAALRRASNTNTYTLRDLGSSNGTFIAIRNQQLLSPGDHLRIGQHLFRLDVQRGGLS